MRVHLQADKAAMQAPAVVRVGGAAAVSTSQQAPPVHSNGTPAWRRVSRHALASQPGIAASVVLSGSSGSRVTRPFSRAPPLLWRRRTPPVLGSKGAVPDVPVPGDDQGSTIYTLLARETGEFDDVPFDLALNSNGSGGGPTTITALSSQQQQQEAEQPAAQHQQQPPEPQRRGIPHRWQVVGMMALSFVLCNMDKVRFWASPWDSLGICSGQLVCCSGPAGPLPPPHQFHPHGTVACI